MRTFCGTPIVESIHLTEPYTDWSRCRSPSRAARRLRQGHPQRVRYLQRPRKDGCMIGDKLYMHPETAKEFYRELDALRIAKIAPATECVPAPVSDPNRGLFWNLSPFHKPIFAMTENS